MEFTTTKKDQPVNWQYQYILVFLLKCFCSQKYALPEHFKLVFHQVVFPLVRDNFRSHDLNRVEWEIRGMIVGVTKNLQVPALQKGHLFIVG